jgi:hypothetical protein
MGGIDMQTIKAKMLRKTVQVELPINVERGESAFLEKYLKGNGYKFNKEKKCLECEYKDDGGKTHILIWHMRSTLHGTIIHTFLGDIFPFEKNVRKIICPILPRCYYTIEGEGKDADHAIEVLFKKKFEIVGLTENGITQVFRNKNNEVKLLYQLNDKFELSFKGFDNMSRYLLASFAVS